jgi:hypothetical protein
MLRGPKHSKVEVVAPKEEEEEECGKFYCYCIVSALGGVFNYR